MYIYGCVGLSIEKKISISCTSRPFLDYNGNGQVSNFEVIHGVIKYRMEID